ncbi:MAG TPA: hypothetical protein PLX02_05970 [Syntrophorhabdaceae bacterium]|nr:hypothetical protein [Syntrophorhabdaceae bacterium]HQM81152.1 hypothetical protein [Syntrophorhabdaceae bacterium]
MDDLFDILGISIFASGGKWCTLNNMPCIPFPSCDPYRDGDTCRYESVREEEDDTPTTPHT